MPIALQGKSGSAAEVDGTTFRANRVTRRAPNYECYGQYQVGVTTGILTAALTANKAIFGFTWGDPECVALITYLSVTVQPEVAYTANTLTDFGYDAYRVRSATATTGGQTITIPNGHTFKTRTSMGQTRAAAMNYSTSAALNVFGTVDPSPFASSRGMFQRVNPTTGTTEEQVGGLPFLEFSPQPGNGEMPVLLQGNEVIIVRNRGAWPAAGTAEHAINMRWSEFEKTKY
jgi:hypothetical protein